MNWKAIGIWVAKTIGKAAAEKFASGLTKGK